MKKALETKSDILPNSLIADKESTIPIDEDVKWTIFTFFNTYDERIDEFKYHSKSENKLNFQLMRRFIFTAYNNLVELDQTISRGKVYKINRDILKMQSIFNELNLFVSKPISLSYDRLFLRKQKSYIEIKEYAEFMIVKMELAKSRANALKSSMNSISLKLKELNPKSKAYEELESQYKKNNGEYVDNLHEISQIKDKREILLQKIKDFEMSNLELFTAEFYVVLNSTIADMNEILDGLAYEFDTILWQEARNSEIIRKFFAEAKIQGSFSSKTFLKYYLKSVDEEQARETNRSLFELLNYLESVSTKHIHIVTNDSDEAQRLRYSIEGIDKDYIVSSSISSDRVFVEYQRRKINLLIIDYMLKNDRCATFLKSLWGRFSETKKEMKVIVRFENPLFEEIDEVGFLGVESFIRTSISTDEFIDKIKSVL